MSRSPTQQAEVPNSLPIGQRIHVRFWPKADITMPLADVCYWPKADMKTEVLKPLGVQTLATERLDAKQR